MDATAIQSQIDAIHWYHEFDFGNGLRNRPHCTINEGHRRIWAFIERHLDQLDFGGKSVLDIGCWDGYWSFYAERCGAGSVLATDDRSQNWSDGRGIHLAKELLGSSIEINQAVSVYELTSLNRKFDIILFLGVYYHLVDPFYALAQLRHCCHPGTIVVIEGTVGAGMDSGELLYDLANHGCETLLDPETLRLLVQAAYLREECHEVIGALVAPPPVVVAPTGRLGWRWRLRMCLAALTGSRPHIRTSMRVIEPEPVPPPRVRLMNSRMLLVCKPFEGINQAHGHRPPFGLLQYDARFAVKGRVEAA